MENNTQNNAPESVPVKKSSNNLSSIIIVLCVIAIGIFLLIKTDPKPKDTRNPEEISLGNINTIFTPPTQEEHVLGDLTTAKVVIVEYSDTECPFCKRFHETMHTVLSDSNGKVAWVYRHFPIEQLHSKAPREALATECAWEQGGNETFWAYTDEIYNQTGSNDTLPEIALTNIASDLNLDINKFQNCLKTEGYKEKVDAQILSGQNLGVEGTPSSFVLVNGLVVDTIKGALPYASVMSQIKKYLE